MRPFMVLASVVLLAGACGGSGGGEGASRSAETSNPAASGATSSTPGGPGSTGPKPAPGAGAAASPGKSAPIPQPATNEQAPSDGRYEYVTTATGAAGDQQQGIQVLTIKTESDGPTVRQTHRLSAGGRDTVQTMEWRPDGVWVLSQRAEEGGSSTPQCDWDPDLYEWPLPFRIGTTWTSESTCAVSSTTRTVKLSGKVVRIEDIEIGGKTVRAVVLERERTDTVLLDGQVPLESKDTSTDWVGVDSGLVLRSTSTVKGSGGLSSGTRERRLTSTTSR